MTWQAWKDQFNYPAWNLAAWVVWAGMFGVLEFMGVKWGDRYATLTFLCKHAIPRFALAMFLGWLTFHFLEEITR